MVTCPYCGSVNVVKLKWKWKLTTGTVPAYKCLMCKKHFKEK